MKKKIIIIGAGINGLVAANYLARGGFEVTMLERKDHPGGACCAGIWEYNGAKYEYPQGASVLGFMEDFVFEETGLSKKVVVHRPEHPELIYAPGSDKPYLIWDDTEKMVEEAKKWGENGKVREFLEDMERVVEFLRQGYRKAIVPTVQSAIAALGPALTELWITGSARKLLDHYLTFEPYKIFFAVNVIESGPVSLDSPYSAFTIPLMVSGSVFDGEWGYVRGGLWQVPLQLDAINAGLGVKRIFNAKVNRVASDNMSVEYELDGKTETISGDNIIFATDPLSAARMLDDQKLKEKIEGEKLVGTSGKLIMFFKNPVRWKDDTGIKHFQSAFRHIIPVKNIEEFEEASNAVIDGGKDFTPGYYEIYCEGAGNAELGGKRDYELVSIFFKNMALSKTGDQLPEVQKQVERAILDKIINKEDLIHTILETPKDIEHMFFFPGGNIDAVDLAEGQTFFQRNYSPDPENNFYQFGPNSKIYYCAAGAYPCGSVAGTPGYMCAQQLINKNK